MSSASVLRIAQGYTIKKYLNAPFESLIPLLPNVRQKRKEISSEARQMKLVKEHLFSLSKTLDGSFSESPW